MREMECLVRERFEWLEMHGRVTVTEFAKRMGIRKDNARNWLSRMTNYPRHIERKVYRRPYLVYEPPERATRRVQGKRVPNEGTYRINPSKEIWWGELFYSGNDPDNMSVETSNREARSASDKIRRAIRKLR